MNFRTPIPIPKSNRLIDYNSKIVSLGSCFAVNMAEKLDYFKFQNTCNPFGILFHPLAIEKFIDFAVSKKQFTENDIFFHNELWHCFDAHSDLSNPDREELLVSLNAVVQSTKIVIEQASHVIITYGTSWVYKNKESNEIVANCHKRWFCRKSMEQSKFNFFNSSSYTNRKFKIKYWILSFLRNYDG